MEVIEEKHKPREFLVETDWLEKNLNNENLRIFDCAVNAVINPDVEKARNTPFVFNSGRSNYELGHIPGAGFIDIPSELSDKLSSLPLMLPEEKQFVEVMSKHGISDDAQVVLYSSSEPIWAARVWWMLHEFGFNNAAILNGGWSSWVAEKRPVSIKSTKYEYSQFNVRARRGAFVSKEDVLAAIDNNKVCIINALPSQVFEGSSEVFFGRRGRITGSVNIPFQALHDPDTKRYLAVEELQNKFDEIAVSDVEHIITYCGGGVAAANNAFVLAMLGFKNVSVYDASMLEWGNDESLPMEMN